ncbi:helix-turn-helix domain-containing protein [Pseudomonadota bacterium]
MDLKQYIGARVKSARLKQGLTQEQLAAHLDKSVETVSNLERGTYMTSLDTLHLVGAYLDVPMTYFFEGADDDRDISVARLAQELELRRLAEALNEQELGSAIRLVKALPEKS